MPLLTLLHICENSVFYKKFLTQQILLIQIFFYLLHTLLISGLKMVRGGKNVWLKYCCKLWVSHNLYLQSSTTNRPLTGHEIFRRQFRLKWDATDVWSFGQLFLSPHTRPLFVSGHLVRDYYCYSNIFHFETPRLLVCI